MNFDVYNTMEFIGVYLPYSNYAAYLFVCIL